MIMTLPRLMLLASASSITFAPLGVHAQAAQDEPDTAVTNADPDSSQNSENIVVTGTLIRGVAPTGTNVIGVSQEDITATGATSTNDLLATIPQNGTFNAPPSIPAGV